MKKQLALLIATFWISLSVLVMPVIAATDRALCTAADAGPVCSSSEMITSANEEIGALDIRAPMELLSVAGTDNYTASVTPTLLTYSNPQSFWFKPPNNNTGASQLNINSIAFKALNNAAGGALAANDLVTTNIYLIRYFAANDEFRVMTALGAGPASVGNAYVTVGNTIALSAERAITAGVGLGGTDGGANSTWTINLTDAELVCILGQTSAADKISYWTGSGTCGLADFPSTFRTFLTTSSLANLAAVLSDEPSGWTTFNVTPSNANLAAFLNDEAAGYATFMVTPSMANLGSFLTDDAAGWTTFGQTPTSANLGALLTNELDSASKVLLFLGAPADDQVAVGDSATATTWRALPDSDAATQKLQYDAATNVFSAGTDDDVPEVGDFTSLVGGSGIDNNSGTLDLDATEINSIVWGSGTFTTQVFDAGAIDPTWTYSSNNIGLTNLATFVLGNTTSLTTAGIAAGLQQYGTDTAQSSLNLGAFSSTDATAATFNFYKSGNAAVGSATVVASGENLGAFAWWGAQQTGTFANQNQAAGIRATVGGTVTSGAGADMPGNLIFCTTPDASGTCTDRLTINAAGLSTFTGDLTVGANNVTATNVEMANGTANTLTASAGTLSIEGSAMYRVGGTDVALADGGTGASLVDPNADRMFFWDDSAGAADWLVPGAGLLVTTTTLAFDYSDQGASPSLAADACQFTSNATTGGFIVCEGDTANTFETRITVTDPTADRLLTIPDADSVAVQPQTCGGSDKVSAISSAGVISCSADSGGGGGGITIGTSQATTSGTSIDFTGIASGADRVTVMLVGTSVNGTSPLLLQLGDSGGIENTGYTSVASRWASGTSAEAASTAGINVNGATAAYTYHGTFTLSRVDGDQWVVTHQSMESNTNVIFMSSGSKTLSAELDRIRLTTVGGVNTFDAGSMNISYE